MNRTERCGLLFGMLLLAALTGVASVCAQSRRDSLVAEASGERDTDRQIRLLVTALDPRLGTPSDTSWAVGVQLLAQTLLDRTRDSAGATLWLRWAIRQSSTLQPDVDRFLTREVIAFRAALDFVFLTRTAGDTVTQATWLWSSSAAGVGPGWIEVDTSARIPVQVSVDGAVIALGRSVQIPPGSHEIHGWAAGHDSVSVTREVLPGVTTILAFRLHPPPSRTIQQPLVAPRKGKGFPWVLAALGAGGAGVAIALLIHHGPPPPTTGGIIINFPP